MRARMIGVVCGLLLLGGRGGATSSFTYYAIDVPCSACSGGIAPRTAPGGINAAGEIVGGFTDAVGGQHGFLLSRGQFTTIDVPGSLVGVTGSLPTTANGINPSGDIVGQFTVPYHPPVSTSATIGDPRYCPAAGSPACIKGFLYRHGGFSVVLFPGHPGAIPEHITPDGDIYGCLHDYDLMTSMVGAMWTHSGDSSLAAGGGELTDSTESFPSSMNNGAAGNGVTVGLWDDMNSPGHRHGFLVQDGVFRSYDVPRSTVSLTVIWDMNREGQFVGTYVDATGRHGFLQNPDGSAPIQLDATGGANTVAFGINPDGAVVGTYTASGKTRGFLAVPAGE